MSRLARDFSWHVILFVMMVAGLSLFAPLAWWNREPPRRSVSRTSLSKAARKFEAAPFLQPDEFSIAALQPQTAAVGPLVADQITHDPSIHETPPIPAARPILGDEAAVT